MKTYFFRRLLSSLFVILGVVTLVFFLVHFIPGDPVDILLGDAAEAADKQALRSLMGLDKPLLEQYFVFWKNIFNGTWGQSLSFSRNVLDLVIERFIPTFLLSLTALLFGLSVSLCLGINAARKAGKFQDSLSVAFALIGMSIPTFVVAPLAILYFSIHLRWFPVAGYGTLAHLILPTACLGFGLSGILTRMVRTSILETLGEDYIRTARSKGLSEKTILLKHALRNSLIPILTVTGNILGGLLAGAVITETIFDWPGLGKLFYVAFQSRDYPLIQGVVLWISVVYVFINFIIDMLYSWIDPRVRLES